MFMVLVVPSAIKDAQQNATLNGFENTTFVCGKAEEVIIKWKQQGIKPDVVMVDPPRKGCDETFLQTLLKLNLSVLSTSLVILLRNKEMLKY